MQCLKLERRGAIKNCPLNWAKKDLVGFGYFWLVYSGKEGDMAGRVTLSNFGGDMGKKGGREYGGKLEGDNGKTKSWKGLWEKLEGHMS